MNLDFDFQQMAEEFEFQEDSLNNDPKVIRQSYKRAGILQVARQLGIPTNYTQSFEEYLEDVDEWDFVKTSRTRLRRFP